MFAKTKDKVKEVAGEMQEKYGELTDDYEHQVKGTVQKVVATVVRQPGKSPKWCTIMLEATRLQPYLSQQALVC